MAARWRYAAYANKKKQKKHIRTKFIIALCFFENIGKISAGVKKKTGAQTKQIIFDNRQKYCPSIPLLDIKSPSPYILQQNQEKDKQRI